MIHRTITVNGHSIERLENAVSLLAQIQECPFTLEVSYSKESVNPTGGLLRKDGWICGALSFEPAGGLGPTWNLTMDPGRMTWMDMIELLLALGDRA